MIRPGAVLWLALAVGAPSQDGRKPDEFIPVPETDLKIEMVYVPGGRFRMGSPDDEPGRGKDEGPAREVELKPFWISRHEVPAEAFSAYYEIVARDPKAAKADAITRPSKPYEGPQGTMQGGRHPAVNMRWHNAVGFCEWLSRKMNQEFRLPTEAEWEYAARAGSSKAAPEPLDDHAWHQANSGAKTHEGGQKKPNAFGLCDMLGNVWEYCLEFTHPPGYGPVLRGGAWNSPAADLRFANRQAILEEWYERDPNRPRSMWWLTDATFVGFRIARFAEPGEKREQDVAAAKVEVGKLKLGALSQGLVRVTGEVRNGGDRAIEELQVAVHYMDEKGRPLYLDYKNRATFSTCHPVLANSRLEGEHRRPLKPGETRPFALDVPQPFDYDIDLDQVGAAVTALQFAR